MEKLETDLFKHFGSINKFYSLTKLVFLCLMIFTEWSWAMNNTSSAAGSLKGSGYNQPPQELLNVMRAPPPPIPLMSPRQNRFLLVGMNEYPSIDQVATPYLRLAGVRLEPQSRGRHDTPGGYGIPSCVSSLSVVMVAEAAEKKIDISKLSCASTPIWSADGKHFLFKNKTKKAVELWVGSAESAKIFQLPGVKLNAMLGQEAQWMPDQRHILVKMVPKNLGVAPVKNTSLGGPSIQESTGESGQSSTYEKRDTLTNQEDEQLFDYYGKSQLALVNIQSKAIRHLGSPAIYDELGPAPDGIHILVTQILRPYSYLVTYSRFPTKVEVLDISKLPKIQRSPIVNLPLADRVPIHGERLGPREFFWNPHEPATLFWVEALDGGDWNVKVPARDKVMQLAAPFQLPPLEVFRTEQRFEGLQWFEQRSSALLYEFDQNKHWIKAFKVNVDNPQQEKKLLWDLSSDEKYANPGQPITKVLKTGHRVIRQNQNSFYLAGQGASPDGNRPFLDKMDLSNFNIERLFRSSKIEYESFLSFVDEDYKIFLTRHQTPDDFPNVYQRSLVAPIQGSQVPTSASVNSDTPAATQSVPQTVPLGEELWTSTRKALTHFKDPTPLVRKIKKRLVQYKRADGLMLSFTLYTPPDYKDGTRVPTILYAYPLDYADASKAGQVTGSQATFTRLRDYKLLLLAGYAVIDNAAFPIVGDPKKAYDTYTEQLVEDAKSAVNEAIKMGVADPDRVGVTGHSHGALMTVNLLTHTNLFKAGVATSGSYNKTLTPFGFQNERRTVWEAPEVYNKVSPFFFADKLKTPLLIIHGDEDANPGTTPMQAHFLYEAVRGNGGTVRLVMLPHEPHWYSARESNEQQIYEMLRWFDKYVKATPTTSQ